MNPHDDEIADLIDGHPIIPESYQQKLMDQMMINSTIANMHTATNSIPRMSGKDTALRGILDELQQITYNPRDLEYSNRAHTFESRQATEARIEADRDRRKKLVKTEALRLVRHLQGIGNDAFYDLGERKVVIPMDVMKQILSVLVRVEKL